MSAVEHELKTLQRKDDAMAREVVDAQEDVLRLKQQLGAHERDRQVPYRSRYVGILPCTSCSVLCRLN